MKPSVKNILIIGVVILSGILLLCLLLKDKKEQANFNFSNSELQYFPPELSSENDYMKCILQNCTDENDMSCLEMCRRNAFKQDAVTAKELVCFDTVKKMNADKKVEKELYENCLTSIYSDHRYP